MNSEKPPYVQTFPLWPYILSMALLFVLEGCRGGHVSPPTLPIGVINISNNSTTSSAPAAAASGNDVYVAWTDQDGPQNIGIFLSRSTDGGATFGAPINISNSSAAAGNAKLALSGGSLYIIWEEFVPSPTGDHNDSDIFFRRADVQNGTLVWDPSLSVPGKNLSPSPPVCGPSKNASCPSQNATIAASGDAVFVAWGEATDYVFKATGQFTDFVLINSNILMTASFDRGATFNPPIDLSGPKVTGTPCADVPQSPSINPSLAAAAGGPLYIAWEDCKNPDAKILFRRFPNPQLLASSTTPTVSLPPLNQSAITLSGSITGSTRPSLAADGDTLFLLWEGLPFGNVPSENDPCPLGSAGVSLPNSEILLKRSTDRGTNFDAEPSNLSNSACSSNNGKIVSAAPFLYVAWEDNTPGLNGISLIKSNDGGLTFAPRTNLSPTGGSAANPALAASGPNLFTFWEDATLGNLEILFGPPDLTPS